MEQREQLGRHHAANGLRGATQGPRTNQVEAQHRVAFRFRQPPSEFKMSGSGREDVHIRLPAERKFFGDGYAVQHLMRLCVEKEGDPRERRADRQTRHRDAPRILIERAAAASRK